MTSTFPLPQLLTTFYLSSEAFMLLHLFESLHPLRPSTKPPPLQQVSPDHLSPHEHSLFSLPLIYSLCYGSCCFGVCAGLLTISATIVASFYYLLVLVGQKLRKGCSG